MTIYDQNLFVSEYDKLIALDLQTNKTNVLSCEEFYTGVTRLLIVNDKIICGNDCIKIWNLNDQKLFKEFKILGHEILDLSLLFLQFVLIRKD